MSQSDTDDDGEEHSVDTCQKAMGAALEKAGSYCGSEEARVEVLSKLVGLNGADRDFSTEEARAATADHPSSIETRQRVVALAAGEMESGDSPYDAIESAWDTVADEMESAGAADADADPGGSTGEDGGAETSEDEPEAEAGDDGGDDE